MRAGFTSRLYSAYGVKMRNHFPKLLGVDIPQTDFDQRAVTLIHRGLISGYPAQGAALSGGSVKSLCVNFGLLTPILI